MYLMAKIQKKYDSTVCYERFICNFVVYRFSILHFFILFSVFNLQSSTFFVPLHPLSNKDIMNRENNNTTIILIGMLLSIAAPLAAWYWFGDDIHNLIVKLTEHYKAQIMIWAILFLISNIINVICPYSHQFLARTSHVARIAFVIISFIALERWWYGIISFVFLFIPGLFTKTGEKLRVIRYSEIIWSNIGTMISVVLLVFAYLSLFGLI